MLAAGNFPAVSVPDAALAAIQRFDVSYQRFKNAEPPTDSPLYPEWQRRRVKLDQIANGLQCIADGSRDALGVAHSVLGQEQVHALLSQFARSKNRLGNPFIAVGAILAVISFYGYKMANEYFAYQTRRDEMVASGQLPAEQFGPGPGPFANLAQVIKWSVLGLGAVVILPTVLATLGVIQETRQVRSTLRGR